MKIIDKVLDLLHPDKKPVVIAPLPVVKAEPSPVITVEQIAAGESARKAALEERRQFALNYLGTDWCLHNPKSSNRDAAQQVAEAINASARDIPAFLRAA